MMTEVGDCTIEMSRSAFSGVFSKMEIVTIANQRHTAVCDTELTNECRRMFVVDCCSSNSVVVEWFSLFFVIYLK